MKKRKALKQVIALLLIFTMTFTMSKNSVFAFAAGKSSKVKISAKKLTLTVGKSKKLKITGVKEAKITWKSSNKKVASVSQKGKVKAVKKGKANITATVRGTKQKSPIKLVCKVTVKANPEENKTPAATTAPTPETPTMAPVTPTPEPSVNPNHKYYLPATEGYQTYAPSAKEVSVNNPLLINSYACDPYAMEYNGRLYVYMTNDSQQYEKTYYAGNNTYENIAGIHIISTDDMVNWTDHGIFQITGKNGVCSYMNCCWAPCAVHKTVNGKEKFYIYFTNGGWQMGVVEADSPIGPFRDVKGEALLNASDTSSSPLDPACFIDDDGTVFGDWGNNHHSMAAFQGKYYMFYHTMVLQSLLGCSLGYRSTQVNEVAINEDGTIEQVKQDREGVSQIKDFNPYQEVSGTTYSNCAGMMSVAPGMDGSRMEAFSDAERYQYSWSLVKGVNFGEVSPKTLKINFTGQTEKEAAVKVCVDSLDGPVIAEGKIEADSNGNAELILPVTEITGKHDLYFELEGNVCHFEKWKFE